MEKNDIFHEENHSLSPSTTSSSQFPKRLVDLVELLKSNKANDLLVMDLRPRKTFTEFMIFCTGNNRRHMNTLAKKSRDFLQDPAYIDGMNDTLWSCVDGHDIMVQVFTEEGREVYALERRYALAAHLNEQNEEL